MRDVRVTFPPQKVSSKKKESKEWQHNSLDAVIGRENGGYWGRLTRKEKMGTNYELYNSNFNENDLKFLTDPYKVDDSFPIALQEINIIRPKIDLLVGEESKRPLNYVVIETNDDVVSALQDKKKQLLTQHILAYLGISDEEAAEFTPPQIQEYMNRSYKSIAEEQAHNTLAYLKEKLNLPNEFLRGWKDGLIAGEEIYHVGITNGEPSLKRTNPLYCDYDRNPDLECIEDGDWFIYHCLMSPAQIYDIYQDKLEEKDLDKLIEMARGNQTVPKAGTGDVNSRSIMYREHVRQSPFGYSPFHDEDGDSLDVYHGVWRSWQKIGFLTVPDPETGEEEVIQVSDAYKPIEGDVIEWDWIPQIYEGYRVSDDLYFGIQPVDYMDVPLESPERYKLPYIGVIYSNTNSRNKSLVSIMKSLQYMYIEVFYRMNLMLARDKGRVLNMDVTQIPKSMGIDVNKWLHYLSALGVNLINPYEEGWDIPGREGGKPAQFNGISAQDLSMTNVIAGYLELLDKIDGMVGELSGVSKQRQGQIQQRELVGNVERSVIQSSHITEPLFWKHNLAKKNTLTCLLNVAKTAWANTGKEKLHFIFNDAVRIFMDITDDFLYSDFDVFLSDSSKEHMDIEKLHTLIQPAMQNGTGLLDAAEILTADNLTEIKTKLRKLDEERQQREQAQIEAQQRAQMEATQAQMELATEENRIKEEDSIRKADTAIQVALINAESRGEGEGEGDDADFEKARLQAEKIRGDYELKNKQLGEDARKNRKAEEQRDKEIEIKRKQANKPVAAKTK
jgi:hypothetical protein